jgi:hypothetical protein
MDTQIPEALPIFTGLIGCFMLLIYLILAVVTVWAFCKICSKAGYSWALGLLHIIFPIGTLILILVLGFSDWPIHREMRGLRQQSSIETVR